MGRCKYYDTDYNCCVRYSTIGGAYQHFVPCRKCEQFVPITNYDRIKVMNVKQLAEFICGIHDTVHAGGKVINGTIIPDYDKDKITEWLNSEVEE